MSFLGYDTKQNRRPNRNFVRNFVVRPPQWQLGKRRVLTKPFTRCQLRYSVIFRIQFDNFAKYRSLKKLVEVQWVLGYDYVESKIDGRTEILLEISLWDLRNDN